jgi:hypothetical protein
MVQQRNPDSAALKNRRTAAAASATPATPPDPPLADVAVAIGEHAARRFPVLFDPREPAFQPMEASGIAPPGVVDDRYVVATEDASEQIYPPGCRTPVVRSMWRAGQHVPRHVFEAWQARQQAMAEDQAEVETPAVQQPEPPADAATVVPATS